MDRVIYLAMNGAKQLMLAQAANAENLANVSTTGFRADLNQFRSMPEFGPGLPSRVYAMSEQPGVDFTPGPVIETGRSLDVAVNGSGWIAVQAPDGQEAYTRAGDFRISSGGVLVTGAGYPVLGNSGPIAIPEAQKLEIGADGTISIRPVGQAATTLTQVDRIKLVNPPQQNLVKIGGGLMRLRSGATAPADSGVQVTSGALESSNVDAVDALVNMIELARRFDMQVKLMHTADQDAQDATQIMRVV